MMKMTVREAMAYLKNGNGKPIGEEAYSKVIALLDRLPQSPHDRQDGEMLPGVRQEDVPEDFAEWLAYVRRFRTYERTVKDYTEGWFAQVRYGRVHDGILLFEVLEEGKLPPSKQRVKTNEEALELMKAYDDVKFADDLDRYWEMSDDHRTMSWGRERDQEARQEQLRIAGRLV